MNTLFKILFIFFALAITTIVTVILAFYFSPGLQKRVFLGVLSGKADVSADVDHISFRLSRTEIRGLSISSGKESIRLGTLEADYSMGGLFGKSIRVGEVRISGLDLDVAAAGGEQLKGAFIKSSSKYDSSTSASKGTNVARNPIHVGLVRIDGSVRLPNDLNMTFSLKMDDIKPASAGAMGLNVDVLTRGPEAPFQEASVRLTGALHQTGDGSFDRLEGQLLGRLLENYATEWVELSLKPTFVGSASEFETVLNDLKLVKGDTRLLDGTAKANGSRKDGTAWLVGYSAQLNSDLALVSRLSIIPVAEPLQRGNLILNVSGQIIEGNRASLNGVFEIRNLLPGSYTGRPLSLKLEPALTVDFTSKTLEVSSPLRVVGPSTLTTGSLTAKLMNGADGRLGFDSLIDVDEFNPEEWKPLASVLKKEQAETVSEKDSTPDEKAPWSQLQGKAVARVGRLHLGSSYFDDIALSLSIDNGKTVLGEVAARSGQTPVRAAANLSFDALKPAQPYSLNGTVAVQGLDVAPFLKAPNLNRPVLLEGVFNAKGTFKSDAPNLAFLGDFLTGDILLQSAGQGIFRPLGEKTSLATGISGLLGALGGSSNKVGWVQEVINQLKEIPFTQMTFRVGREENLNFFLKELDLVSRETRIKGEGMVDYSEGTPILKLPMDLELKLFAKGKLAEALRKGNQLRSDEPDPMGYFPGPPLPIRGSLAQPESLLINLLMDSSSQLLPGLLGPGK